VTTTAASATRYINAGAGSAAGKLAITDTLAGQRRLRHPELGHRTLQIAVGGATTTATQIVTVELSLVESF